jgi:hypothetical protein
MILYTNVCNIGFNCFINIRTHTVISNVDHYYTLPEENIAGPTVLWIEIKDKKVKSKDGKTLGQIKRISDNHFKIQKGSVRKKSFWIPKNEADAYDGKSLWLSSNEEEIHDKFLYGEEPPENDQTGSPIDRVRLIKERMVGMPTEPADSSKPYKNIRDLK